jgi:UDP-N-acetylmuramoyl-tripeptide--D-alanyl-D-alanine ligase
VPDGDAALALLRAEVRPGDVVLVKASNAAGLGALADALAAEGSDEGSENTISNKGSDNGARG